MKMGDRYRILRVRRNGRAMRSRAMAVKKPDRVEMAVPMTANQNVAMQAERNSGSPNSLAKLLNVAMPPFS